MPARSSQRKSVLPALPANGFPPAASTWPGACPTNMAFGRTAQDTIGRTSAGSLHARQAASAAQCTAKLASRLFADSLIVTSPRNRRTYCATPTTKALVRYGAMPRWLKRRESSRRDEIVCVAPHTSRETGQARCPEGGRFNHVGPFDRDAKHIGLK